MRSLRDSELEDLYRGVQPEMRRPKPSPEALAAALEAAQRLAAEADAEQAADDTAQELTSDSTIVCRVCGYRNRTANKYCGMCGIAVSEAEAESGFPAEAERPPSRALALPPNPFPDPERDPEFEPERKPAASRSLGTGNSSLPSPLSSPLFSWRTGSNGCAIRGRSHPR